MVGLLTPLGQGRNIIPLCWWAETAQCLAPVGAQNIHCMNLIVFVLKKASGRCLQSLTSFTQASCPSHCLGGLTLRLVQPAVAEPMATAHFCVGRKARGHLLSRNPGIPGSGIPCFLNVLLPSSLSFFLLPSTPLP